MHGCRTLSSDQVSTKFHALEARQLDRSNALRTASCGASEYIDVSQSLLLAGFQALETLAQALRCQICLLMAEQAGLI